MVYGSSLLYKWNEYLQKPLQTSYERVVKIKYWNLMIRGIFPAPSNFYFYTLTIFLQTKWIPLATGYNVRVVKMKFWNSKILDIFPTPLQICICGSWHDHESTMTLYRFSLFFLMFCLKFVYMNIKTNYNNIRFISRFNYKLWHFFFW